MADRAASLGLSAREHRRLADVLLLAARRRRPVAPLTARYPELTLADAACIRDAVVARRVEQGDPLVGARASFEATPHLSWLTESALVQDEVLDATPLIAPRVRQVIVFRVGRALSRPEALLTSIAAVHHGLEILDSRYNGGAVSEIDAGSTSSSWSASTINSLSSWCRLDVVVVTGNLREVEAR